MARYRTKDEIDLNWNRIRRQLTRELDTQIQNWREDALNRILSRAWERYTAALESGERPELESHYENFVAIALAEVESKVVE